MSRSKPKPIIVLVTSPNLATARRLARLALTARLAACVNLVPGIQSYYWWKSKLERSVEVLLLLKSTANRAKALEKLIISNHPYDTPEFVVLPVGAVNHPYRTWWIGAVA